MDAHQDGSSAAGAAVLVALLGASWCLVLGVAVCRGLWLDVAGLGRACWLNSHVQFWFRDCVTQSRQLHLSMHAGLACR
jgi:hypothetical protein